MKREAELPEITKLVAALSKASSLGTRIQDVLVEPGEFENGDPYLRGDLFFDHTDDLQWDMVKPLVTSIEDAVEEIDHRYPSVRLSDPV